MTSPFVSVIIPVYNDTARLNSCLKCLSTQTYPRKRFEVVVVDNGSDEPIEPRLPPRDNVICVHEPTAGSYTARNRGLEAAKGEVLAFTDSDCRPDPTWIEKGVAALEQLETPGLVAGRIELFFQAPAHPTWVELYEQVFAFPQEENVSLRHYGATANMFTKRSVFDEIGGFDDRLKSGGDREWGNRVHEAGLPLRYAKEVMVRHPARRNAREYFAKAKRTIHGHYALRNRGNRADVFQLKRIIRDFVPPFTALYRVGRLEAPPSAGDKIKVGMFLVTYRYYRNLLRLKMALWGDALSPPR